MAVNDNILISKAKKGDRNAFKNIYDRYHTQLYFVAKRYLKDDSLAEDAIQDIFLKLWSKRKELDKSQSLKGFLFTMLKNHLLNMLRKQDNRRKVQEGYKKLAQNKKIRSLTEEEIVYAEYQDIISRGLQKLSPAKRKVFKMRSFEGLSNSEVAKKNNVSVHTVKTQFYLGSKFIRNYLKKHADF